jgi:hypothetical protein
MRRLKYLCALLACVALSACKEYKPGPTCAETVPITERNGHKVRQALNGVYLKADEIDMRACGSNPYSKDPWQSKFVLGIHQNYYWGKGRLMRTKAELREVGLEQELDKLGQTQVSWIELNISFEADPRKFTPPPAWWYSPAMPHQRYPIDLLPNARLDQPDPGAGVGPVLSKEAASWAVRGTKHPDTGMPYTTLCNIRPPPGNIPGSIAYERDPKWLVQGETYTEETIGNTCRGGVWATNGKLAAMIDVPGAALPDIDKIYQAASLKLTDLTVE